MYVVTFYSFKGGVGRTLALMNVAAHLVDTGKTVLVVDFDLEAPGLDSFPWIRSDQHVPGIVEFVSEYLQTSSAPSVRDFVSECSLSEGQHGRLFLMRSGLRDKNYSARLSRIDWQRLYAERDGYLLFEDLKAQWVQEFRPDYVLIDSRTGHTDVGGICTRQLPDAVVACFIPNEENVSGLETVVSDIRKEAEGPSRRDIRIYFVPSNVPNLDDEMGILDRRIREAGRRLTFEAPSCIIHRYESLTLLDNAIFVKDRSGTRLAKEFRELSSIITEDNLRDRIAALRLLRTNRLIEVTGPASRSIERKIQDIQTWHSGDGEVLHELGKLLRRLGREEDAQRLALESELHGFRSAETVLDAAFRDLVDENRRVALDRVRDALELPDSDYFDISRAIQLCVKLDTKALDWVFTSSAFRRLDTVQKVSLCEQILVSREAAGVAERVLEGIANQPRQPSFITSTTLMLALIAQGKFEAAMRVLGPDRPSPSALGIVEAFNYAIAEWGASRVPPVDLFSRVLEEFDFEDEPAKNPWQAAAIAAWAKGDRADAERCWRRAFDLSISEPAATFSAWRYLEVSGAQFQNDLAEVRQMIDGAAVLPLVLSESWNRG